MTRATAALACAALTACMPSTHQIPAPREDKTAPPMISLRPQPKPAPPLGPPANPKPGLNVWTNPDGTQGAFYLDLRNITP